MLGQNTCNVSDLPPRIMKRYFPFELFPGLRMKWDPFQIFSSPSRRKDIVTNFSNVIKVITFGWVVSLLAIFFCLPLCRFPWSCSKTAKTIQKRPSKKNFWLRIPVQCPSGVFFLHPHDQRTISLPIYHGDIDNIDINDIDIVDNIDIVDIVNQTSPSLRCHHSRPYSWHLGLSCSANARTQLQKHKYKYTNTVVRICSTVLQQRILQLEDFRTSSCQVLN